MGIVAIAGEVAPGAAAQAIGARLVELAASI
jgi:hypothetical protein